MKKIRPGVTGKNNEEEAMIKFTENHRYGMPTEENIKNYEPIESAEPTNRVLGPEEGWAAEEWSERGTISGKPCTAYYLFAYDEIEDEYGDPIDPEHYPWDDEHIERVVIFTEND